MLMNRSYAKAVNQIIQFGEAVMGHMFSTASYIADDATDKHMCPVVLEPGRENPAFCSST